MDIELRPESVGDFHAVRRWFVFFLSLICCLLCLLVPLQLLAASKESVTADADENVLEVFVRDGCPHCAKAKKFLTEFRSERPWLIVNYRSVDHDPVARDALLHYSRAAGIWPPGVPTFYFNGQLLVGFDSPEHTGSLLKTLVEQAAINPARVETSLFGVLSVSSLGLPLFTLALGLLDGFNPCAMWVLLFLLSLLVHLQDRKRMALIAGTFVLVSGAIYFAFMAAWLNVFLLIGISTALHWMLGSLALAVGGINIKDFFIWKQGFSLSIPNSAKPGLYARIRAILIANKLLPSLIATAILAVVVNFIELLCTTGFPAIYTAILAQQDLSPISHYAYLGLYILGYVADDALMVAAAVIALSSYKLTEQTGRWLKLISGIVMLGLGGTVLLYPEWLI